MWTREELKIRAKNVLRGCFWSAVVVALITGILTGSFSSSRSNVQNAREINYNEIQSGGESLVDSATQMITGSGHQTENLLARVAGMSFGLVFLGVGISVMLLGLAFGILVGSPIEVGASRFFMRAFLGFPSGAVLAYRPHHAGDESEDFSLGTSFCDSGHCEILRVPDGSLYSGGKSKSSDV